MATALPIQLPTTTAAMPKAKLPMIYIARQRVSPPFINTELSFMNVEKVVNPPQKPVVRKSFVCGLSNPPMGNAEIRPMTKHPSTLTMNVPKGNADNENAPASLDTTYLMPPPKKLPMPTITNSLSMSHFSICRRRGADSRW